MQKELVAMLGMINSKLGALASLHSALEVAVKSFEEPMVLKLSKQWEVERYDHTSVTLHQRIIRTLHANGSMTAKKLSDQMLTQGWESTSEKPHTVVGQTLNDMRKKRFVVAAGNKPQHWRLTKAEKEVVAGVGRTAAKVRKAKAMMQAEVL